jgi:hypothetical protein
MKGRLPFTENTRLDLAAGFTGAAPAAIKTLITLDIG